MIVVKVGGSLYDHPGLGPALRAFVDSLAPAPVLLVPGGGAVADAVRALDRVHALGEEAAHWVALRSLSVTAAFVRRLLPGAGLAFHPGEPLPPGPTVLDAHAFCQFDTALPRAWAVTTDSIAARAAALFGAERLILLKSVDVPAHVTHAEAVANGWVDPHFPHAARALACPVEVVNFRRALLAPA